MSLAGMMTGHGCAGDVTTTIDRHDAASTDEALVAATRRGDDRAFEQLYGRYQRRIAVYVYGMVGDHGRAEDVTQEVFISALRRIRATDRPIAFKPWIYEIAKNACIDAFRRARRAEEVSFDVADDNGAIDSARLATPAVTPDAAVDAKQQLDDLCGAFGGLSDTHHQILVLRELEGLSYREIGDRLGMSRPAVESTLFRARRRLSEEYGELVSGARCLAVQQLLAGGASGISARDNRRLARHIAHCQPCRREAYAAGVDTAGLAAALRRVAALLPLPLPAMLRLRRGGSLDQLTGQLPAFAEPAAGWGKAAAAAAAVLVAGGAGVAGHAGSAGTTAAHHAARPVAAAHAGGSNPGAIAAAAAAAAHAGSGARHAHPAHRRRLAGRSVVIRVPAAAGAPSGARKRSSGPAVAPAPAATGAVPPAAAAPSAPGPASGGGSGVLPGAPPAPPAPPRDSGPPVPTQAQDAVGPASTTVDGALQQVQDTATKADGGVGDAVGTARGVIAPHA